MSMAEGAGASREYEGGSMEHDGTGGVEGNGREERKFLFFLRK